MVEAILSSIVHLFSDVAQGKLKNCLSLVHENRTCDPWFAGTMPYQSNFWSVRV